MATATTQAKGATTVTTLTDFQARRAQQVLDQENVNAIYAAEGAEAAIAPARASAEAAHQQYPQYDGYWDGWTLAIATTDTRSKGGDQALKGDVVLFKRDSHWHHGRADPEPHLLQRPARLELRSELRRGAGRGVGPLSGQAQSAPLRRDRARLQRPAPSPGTELPSERSQEMAAIRN